MISFRFFFKNVNIFVSLSSFSVVQSHFGKITTPLLHLVDKMEVQNKPRDKIHRFDMRNGFNMRSILARPLMYSTRWSPRLDQRWWIYSSILQRFHLDGNSISQTKCMRLHPRGEPIDSRQCFQKTFAILYSENMLNKFKQLYLTFLHSLYEAFSYSHRKMAMLKPMGMPLQMQKQPRRTCRPMESTLLMER